MRNWWMMAVLVASVSGTAMAQDQRYNDTHKISPAEDYSLKGAKLKVGSYSQNGEVGVQSLDANAVAVAPEAAHVPQTVSAPPSVAPETQSLGTVSAPVADDAKYQAAAEDGVAEDADDLPQEQTVNGTRYITGGVGEVERRYLEARRGSYSLHILNAEKADGAFIGGVLVKLTDASGMIVLHAEADPFFYAQLPAGSYALEARFGNQTKQQKITVPAKGAKQVDLVW